MNLFTLNEGPADRAIRVIIGVILIALVYTGPHTPWGWLGIIPLFTGLVGMCPLYSVLGLSTKSKEAV